MDEIEDEKLKYLLNVNIEEEVIFIVLIFNYKFSKFVEDVLGVKLSFEDDVILCCLIEEGNVLCNFWVKDYLLGSFVKGGDVLWNFLEKDDLLGSLVLEGNVLSNFLDKDDLLDSFVYE